MDMNMGMILLSMIMVLNGYTMATLVLELCLILTSLFFTNPQRKELARMIALTMVYTIGVVCFTALVMPQYIGTFPFVCCVNGFTMICWFNVAKSRKKISRRLDQIALLFVILLMIFLPACWLMPSKWMLLYSPLVQSYLVRIAMSLLVLWMFLPLPLLMGYLHHTRVRYKELKLFNRLMD